MAAEAASVWKQAFVKLKPRPRGCHLVTEEVVKAVPDLATLDIGIANIFIMHTSASLSINENYDADVRADMEDSLNRLVPEDAPYRHSTEGPDDMPAHIKATIIGSNLTIPISKGALALGTWQGIYLCEHRDHGGPRQLVVTLNGQLRPRADRSSGDHK